MPSAKTTKAKPPPRRAQTAPSPAAERSPQARPASPKSGARPAAPKRRRLGAEQRRELILEGAMAVFAERGYPEASMVEIARASGITVAVIYDYFPSKAALQVELLERETAELLAFVGAALERVAAESGAASTATDTGTGTAAAGTGERLRAGVDAFFRFVEAHRFAWRMLFRDAPSDQEVAAAYGRLSAEATARIAAFIEAGAGDALSAYADPAQAAEMFAEMMRMAQNGLAAWWYEHREVPREVIVQRLLDFCWVGLERVATDDR